MKWAAKIKIICFGPPGLPSLDSSLGIPIYKSESESLFCLCLHVSGNGKKKERKKKSRATKPDETHFSLSARRFASLVMLLMKGRMRKASSQQL